MKPKRLNRCMLIADSMLKISVTDINQQHCSSEALLANRDVYLHVTPVRDNFQIPQLQHTVEIGNELNYYTYATQDHL